jgi:hypothetical protein
MIGAAFFGMSSSVCTACSTGRPRTASATMRAFRAEIMLNLEIALACIACVLLRYFLPLVVCPR